MALCLCILLLLVSTTASLQSDSEGDFYVFAQSWQPQFCYGQYTKWAGCRAPRYAWSKFLTIHGLWPQFSTGGWPSYCTGAPAWDPSAPERVGMQTMLTYWPNVKQDLSSDSYDSFWKHEWDKHGTCTGLSVSGYLNASLNLAISFGTASEITNAVGESLNANDLRKAYGGADYCALKCTSGRYFNEVYTCWYRDSNNQPTKQIQCPKDVVASDSCSADTIHIAAFP